LPPAHSKRAASGSPSMSTRKAFCDIYLTEAGY
jgi:hypothetical protein